MSVPNAGGTPAAEPATQPQQGTGTSDATIQLPATTQTPAASATNEPASQTPAANEPTIANPEAKKYADEAAKYRTDLKAAQKRLAELEAAQQAAADAKLSETERMQKQLAELQQEKAQATLATQERILRAEVRAAAISAGINPALAARIVDYAAIEFDDATGDPKNISDLLTKAVTEYGIATVSSTSAAAATPAQNGAQSPAQPALGATNAPRQNGPLVITANQYLDSKFRSDFQQTNGMDILKAVNTGKVKIV